MSAAAAHVAVVLAAGQGTRMKSTLPKVLHPVAGRPMLGWVLDAIADTKPDRTLVVVGHGAEEVEAILPEGTEAVLQADQLGTGDAARVALAHLGDLDADTPVLVIPGDTPLVIAGLLSRLVARHAETRAAVTMATTELDDPSGYGRVLRTDDGSVARIVEERDATDDERAVREINAGMYVFSAGFLAEGLADLRADNAQGEYYLTDVVGGAARAGSRVVAVPSTPIEVSGVNDHVQLAQAAAVHRRRLAEAWMAEGVAMLDPDRVYLDWDVTLAPGVTLYPGVHLEAGTVVDEGATLGPDVYAAASRIGPGATVWYSVLRQATVGPDAQVGPFASLRPGTVLEAGAKAGTFVEMKETTVGAGAKVPHLTYLGDATVGEEANVGAGTITCNYDGFEKHHTHIGARAFIGSDTMLVAPVTVGDDAITGAGSVITRDVEPGALGVERSNQENIEGFAARREARYRARRAEDEDEDEDEGSSA